jgi:hypothetical protein
MSVCLFIGKSPSYWPPSRLSIMSSHDESCWRLSTAIHSCPFCRISDKLKGVRITMRRVWDWQKAPVDTSEWPLSEMPIVAARCCCSLLEPASGKTGRIFCLRRFIQPWMSAPGTGSMSVNVRPSYFRRGRGLPYPQQRYPGHHLHRCRRRESAIPHRCACCSR